MIYNNVELHNIDAVAEGEHGVIMLRVPEETRQQLNVRARDVVVPYTTGVEIRFVMNGDKAIVKLYIEGSDPYAYLPLQLYYGGVASGWVWFDPMNLNVGLNEIVINKPKGLEKLVAKSESEGHAFDCSVIRLLLPSTKMQFVGVEGDVRPPETNEKPQKRIVFYGSSITHGSLSCLTSNTFVNILGSEMNAEVFNKGFPGSCHVSHAMSDYVASRGDCDYAVCEVATNVYKTIPDSELVERIEYLIKTYKTANPDKPLVIIDNLIVSERTEPSRRLVRKAIRNAGLDNVLYINGKKLLTTNKYVMADFTHPTPMGQFTIAMNLLKILKSKGLA